MDSLITAAGRALAAGDPSGALKRVALRDDAPALSLRGIAMAQLGELDRAKTMLRKERAISARSRPFPRALHRSRGRERMVARDLSWATKALDVARATPMRAILRRGACC